MEEEREMSNKNTAVTGRYIDINILFNILSRVPADVLWNNLRFQSKQWFNLISQQTFINANLYQSKQGLIFMERDVSPHGLKFMHFMELKGTEVIGVRKLHDFNTHHVVIHSSCNGLLLTEEKVGQGYTIRNPLTKKYITLPSATTYVTRSELVFIPSAMEYKVVELVKRPSRYYVLRIQSLDGLTRDVEIPVDYVMHTWCRISINGVLYWTASARTNSTFIIMAFDMCNETFQTLHLKRPNDGKITLELMNLAGSLGIVHFYWGDCSAVNAWTLKDMIEGVVEKLFSFDRDHVHIGDKKYSPHRVVGAMNRGGWFIFFEDFNRGIGVYEVKTGQWSLLNHSNYGKANRPYFFHYIHVNSLLSPNHK